jgi:hypothetical protein
MLRDLSTVLSPVLALLLMVLTPLGTGSGAHRDQLLDPLFPHVHVAGPLAPGLVDRSRYVVAEPGSQGTAIGAGAGAAFAALSVGLTPPLPNVGGLPPIDDSIWRPDTLRSRPAGTPGDPPPDPPPTEVA